MEPGYSGTVQLSSLYIIQRFDSCFQDGLLISSINHVQYTIDIRQAGLSTLSTIADDSTSMLDLVVSSP